MIKKIAYAIILFLFFTALSIGIFFALATLIAPHLYPIFETLILDGKKYEGERHAKNVLTYLLTIYPILSIIISTTIFKKVYDVLKKKPQQSFLKTPKDQARGWRGTILGAKIVKVLTGSILAVISFFLAIGLWLALAYWPAPQLYLVVEEVLLNGKKYEGETFSQYYFSYIFVVYFCPCILASAWFGRNIYKKIFKATQVKEETPAQPAFLDRLPTDESPPTSTIADPISNLSKIARWSNFVARSLILSIAFILLHITILSVFFLFVAPYPFPALMGLFYTDPHISPANDNELYWNYIFVIYMPISAAIAYGLLRRIAQKTPLLSHQKTDSD
ncbi:hypothetical protein [Halomonas sp.]|uniref:hypothetical protein n=1 Tax=Halomonas sp. TaxID=1486246 RepID=UPI000C948B67|nr:hypothetical protein [Halomonas sp.]MAR72924.1 hypothetical protein [Halomonas sp.]|tara:strand:+ start:2585 stop:3583 length:999 start_codon:yes stop_codon:yes gene_type:complete